MLRVFPFTLKSVRSSRISFRSLSSIPDQSEPILAPREALKISTEPFRNVFSFKKSFECSGSTIHEVREGGYIDLSDGDVGKYLPEGPAGELKDEFEFSHREAWMVRDVTKLLCRIIETHDGLESKSLPAGEKWRPTPSFGAAPQLDGLTNRPEWDAAHMTVKFYGQDIHNCSSADSSEVLASPVDGTARIEATVDEVSERMKAPGTRRILLTGPRGVGKSVALNQMVMHARSRGWLCFFVPRGWDQVQSGWCIEPAYTLPDGEVIYNNALMTVDALRGFWRAHSGLLSTIPIRDPLAVGQKYEAELESFRDAWARLGTMHGRENMRFLEMREYYEDEDSLEEEIELDREMLSNFDFKNFKLETLNDLVLLGIAFREYSGLAVTDLIHELRALESHPVLLAVDQYNSWEAPSAYCYEEEVIMGKQLCLPRALSFISMKKAETDSFALKNGICVAATSHKHTEGKNVTYDEYTRSIPLVIKVPVYNRSEYLAATSYYMHQSAFFKDLRVSELTSFRMFTGSNPRKTRSESPSYLYPIELSRMVGDFATYNFRSKEVVIDPNAVVNVKGPKIGGKTQINK